MNRHSQLGSGDASRTTFLCLATGAVGAGPHFSAMYLL